MQACTLEKKDTSIKKEGIFINEKNFRGHSNSFVGFALFLFFKEIYEKNVYVVLFNFF